MLISKRPTTTRLLVIATCLLAICGAAAQQSGDVAGSADHSLLPRFGDSTIVEYQQESDNHYRLVLGNMRRIAGRVVAEREQRLRGLLTRITYQMPEGVSGADVVDYYRSQAQQQGLVTLFYCSGRDCGNSNYWANDVFNNRSLYGPERGQYYLALQAESAGGAALYAAVYVITRANRKLYAHVEILQEQGGAGLATGSGLTLESLLQSRSLRIPDLVFDSNDLLIDSTGIDAVLPLLEGNPELALFVVAHLPGPGTLETLMERSDRRAEQVRQALLARGIDGERLVARGVGPLAPSCSEGDCPARVELVMQ